MPDFVDTWKQWVTELERERNDLRMEAHLAKAEARDCLHENERKLEDLRQRGHVLRGMAPDVIGETVVAGSALAAEIREGFARVRQLLGGPSPEAAGLEYDPRRQSAAGMRATRTAVSGGSGTLDERA